jgi:hypothetical protein
VNSSLTMRPIARGWVNCRAKILNTAFGQVGLAAIDSHLQRASF